MVAGVAGVLVNMRMAAAAIVAVLVAVTDR
jgi:hypothetical protein